MILFCYDFLHRKSQDFILFCAKNKIKIDLIVAAPKKELKISKLSFKTSVNVKAIYHPKELSEEYSIDYLVSDHNSKLTENILIERNPEIGMIAGARVLEPKIIKNFSTGIINFHPGDIPNIRGLYSPLRAIKKNHPQAVTSHIIDNKIDLGKIILKEFVPFKKGESIFEIYENIYSKQIQMIEDSLIALKQNKFIEYNQTISTYNNSVPYESFTELLNDLEKYNP